MPTFVAKYFLKSGQKKYANLAQKEETMYITMPQLFYKILLFIHKTCVRNFISRKNKVGSFKCVTIFFHLI